MHDISLLLHLTEKFSNNLRSHFFTMMNDKALREANKIIKAN